jgi:hypothetical protein
MARLNRWLTRGYEPNGRCSSVDQLTMSISAMSSALSGVASAQGMFDAAAQSAAQGGASDAGASAGSGGMTTAAVAEQISVSLLRESLDQERSLVNILA